MHCFEDISSQSDCRILNCTSTSQSRSSTLLSKKVYLKCELKLLYLTFLELLVNIGQSTGIMLDPVYTLKAVRGMLKEMELNPSRFNGKRVLFMHTGMCNRFLTVFQH